MPRLDSYKSLIVWRKACELALELYRLTRAFPREELYGLTSQIRRAAVSIPANIAEGQSRSGSAEYHRFVTIARGSVAELETLLIIATRLGYLRAEDSVGAARLLDEVSRMLTTLRRKLSPPPKHP